MSNLNDFFPTRSHWVETNMDASDEAVKRYLDRKGYVNWDFEYPSPFQKLELVGSKDLDNSVHRDSFSYSVARYTHSVLNMKHPFAGRDIMLIGPGCTDPNDSSVIDTNFFEYDYVTNSYNYVGHIDNGGSYNYAIAFQDIGSDSVGHVDNSHLYIDIYYHGGRKDSSTVADGYMYMNEVYFHLFNKAFIFVNNSWNKSTDEGPRRYKHSIVECSGNVYVLGGYDENNNPSDEVWAYDYVNDSWTQKASLPVKLTNFEAQLVYDINNNPYIICSPGCEYASDNSFTGHNYSFYHYDINNDTWGVSSLIPTRTDVSSITTADDYRFHMKTLAPIDIKNTPSLRYVPLTIVINYGGLISKTYFDRVSKKIGLMINKSFDDDRMVNTNATWAYGSERTVPEALIPMRSIDISASELVHFGVATLYNKGTDTTIIFGGIDRAAGNILSKKVYKFESGLAADARYPLDYKKRFNANTVVYNSQAN